MSKRPKEGRVPRSGVRSFVAYLRDRPIGIKLGFIMFVPTLAIVIVGANGLVAQVSTTNNADRARTLATLTQYSGALVDELQTERADATLLLASPSTNKTAVATANKEFTDQAAKTDTASQAYTVQSSSQANLPNNFRSLLGRIQTQLGGLAALRSQITDTAQIPLSAAVSKYSALISSMLQIRDNASQLAGDSTLSFEMRAASAIASDKEYVSQERYLVIQGILQNSMPAALREQIIAAKTGESQAQDSFTVVATPEQLNWYDLTVSGSRLRPSQIDDGYLDQQQSDAVPAALTLANWNKDIADRGGLLRTVEIKIDAETVGDATTLRNNVQRQIIVDVGLLFGMVLIAMLIAWFVARSMNRSLRELKQGALNVAQNGLPQAVSRLRDPSLSMHMTPHQIALQIAEPLPVRTRDEFGQVTEAFNAVHLEAVRTAAEQAALRSSVATMFVNLARRSQILVDRLIGHLDQLERGEENPDRLSELFQLDHLATRMRRNDENLLVLAGADSTRVQREPAPLIDVLRAAQSEVEHYTRVEFGMIDRDIEVAAHAVNDLVHLVAELFDNATAFSPPDAPVLVEARRIGDRAVLYVEDRGIGVSAEQLAELNERLGTPPMVDVAVSRMMGLVVVARLAHRHNVKVELRPAAERGMIADVLLPTTVLVSRAISSSRSSMAPALAAAEPTREPSRPTSMPTLSQIPPRSAFGPPLALEGGPSTRPRATNGASNGPPTNGSGHSRSNGFDTNGFDSGFDNNGYDGNGFDRNNSDRNGSDRNGSDRNGSDRGGFDRGGSDRGGSDRSGFDRGGFEGNGFGSTGARPNDRRPASPTPSLGGFAANVDAFDASARELLAGSSPNRSLPSWSDLTGSPEASGNGTLGQQMFSTSNNGPSTASPLPQRRASESAEERGEFGSGSYSRIPRQRPLGAGLTGPSPSDPPPPGLPARSVPLDEDRLLDDFAEAELLDERDVYGSDDYRNDAYAPPVASAPPATAPPVWPPVAQQPAPSTLPAAREETGQLQLGAVAHSPALDLTTEIPRIRDLDLAGAARSDKAPSDYESSQHRQPDYDQPDYDQPNYDQPNHDEPAYDEPPHADSSTGSSGSYSGAGYSGDDYSLADYGTTDLPGRSGSNGSSGLMPFADETMELPIFRELESAWFREVDSEDTATDGGDDGLTTDERAESGVRFPTGDGRSYTDNDSLRSDYSEQETGTIYVESSPSSADTTGGAPTSGSAKPAGRESAWRSPADEGWEAAAAALDPVDGGLTDGGLPRRVPMAQLVPGGVEKVTTGGSRRSPDAVRGLLTSYHRGVQRGRQQSDESNVTSDSTGPNSSGGREQEA